MTAFKTQQARWAKGLIQTSKKILPMMFRSDAPFHVKLEALYHLTANISYPLMIVLSTLLHAGHDHPLLSGMVSDAATSTCRCSWRQRFPSPPSISFRRKSCFPGPGTAHVSVSAVPDGSGHRTDGNQLAGRCWKRSSASSPPSSAHPSTASREGRQGEGHQVSQSPGMVPWIELLIGSYFMAAVWYAIDQRELLHRALPAALRTGLLVHGTDVALAGPL